MLFDILKDLKVVDGVVKVGYCEGCKSRILAMTVINQAGIPIPLIGCGRDVLSRQKCSNSVVDLVSFEGLRQRPVEKQRISNIIIV